jgi:hypothetical protein
MAFFGLEPTVALAIGAGLTVLGVALAFWGRGIWRRIMTLIGMILGGLLGFVGGFAIGGITIGGYSISPYILGLILSLIGGLIGSILFAKLMNIALAMVIGGLAGGIVFFSFGAPSGTALGDARLIGAIVTFIAVFAISYYFIEELLGVITAAIGGLLVGAGAYIILWPGGLLVAALGGLGAFILGVVVQTRKVRRQKRIAAAMAAPPTVPAPPPTPPR